jgi:hypothetical protein
MLGNILWNIRSLRATFKKPITEICRALPQCGSNRVRIHQSLNMKIRNMKDFGRFIHGLKSPPNPFDGVEMECQGFKGS